MSRAVDDKTAAAVGRALLSLLELVGPAMASPAITDELVVFPFGLERAAARELERSGKLPVVKLGRRKYAKRSDVLALVVVGAPKKASRKNPSPTSRDPHAAYLALVGGQRRA